jgi:hypothetical protein
VIAKPSAQFVAKMEDVLAVYERPYDPQRPLVCVDEVSKTLHDTPRGTLPIEAGQPPRQNYEYERNGLSKKCSLHPAKKPNGKCRLSLVTFL